MSQQQRPFITCHVLDTVSGKPAADIAVTLKLLSPSRFTASRWTARTNSDGRVARWTSDEDINTVVERVRAELAANEEEERMVWSLTFDVEAYYGKGRCFWPEVELKFVAGRGEEHYHVPLLVGPWSFTSYRGS